MLKIKIVAVGRLKEKYLREASAEYEKRLSAFCKLDIAELEPEKLPDAPNTAQINIALEKEADKIIKAIPQGSLVCPLCIEGKLISSTELAAKIDSAAISGNGNICFIIGGSYGMSDRIKQMADLKLSMSPMTFPHQLARVMLLEQIYRSFKILQGGTYHK